MIVFFYRFSENISSDVHLIQININTLNSPFYCRRFISCPKDQKSGKKMPLYIEVTQKAEAPCDTPNRLDMISGADIRSMTFCSTKNNVPVNLQYFPSGRATVTTRFYSNGFQTLDIRYVCAGSSSYVPPVPPSTTTPRPKNAEFRPIYPGGPLIGQPPANAPSNFPSLILPYPSTRAPSRSQPNLPFPYDFLLNPSVNTPLPFNPYPQLPTTPKPPAVPSFKYPWAPMTYAPSPTRKIPTQPPQNTYTLPNWFTMQNGQSFPPGFVFVLPNGQTLNPNLFVTQPTTKPRITTTTTKKPTTKKPVTTQERTTVQITTSAAPLTTRNNDVCTNYCIDANTDACVKSDSNEPVCLCKIQYTGEKCETAV
ncbi:hypothetical protein SNEBB_003139 [Seison nebaliae]|nr:hypothetical protein SNEBB_003139 [Seison nebaliae]